METSTELTRGSAFGGHAASDASPAPRKKEAAVERSEALTVGAPKRALPAGLRGMLIDGRYRVDRAVGAGGFGVVYAACHIGLGAQVALKVLEPREGIRPEQLATRVGSLLEEARTLKRLRHPNIVAALDVGLLPPDSNGERFPYIVMEWCGGPTLRTLLDGRRGRPMELAEAWALFAPLLAAMEHAHRSGVVHRDLKPENILLESAGAGTFVPRVIDFGIAKIVAPDEAPGSGKTRTASDSRAFTPLYAAPEQLAGARTGPWTDVHALGLLFVELVTGRPATDGDGEGAMKRIDPVRPTPAACGVDVGALEPVLARALALRPSDRYADATAFARAMRGAITACRPEGDREEMSIAEGGPAAHDVRPEPYDATAASDAAAFEATVRDPSPTPRTTGPTIPTARVPARWQRTVAWIAAFAFALTLGLGSVGAIQRRRGSRPFAHQRLRDVPVAEIDRRLAAAGLGACRTHGAGPAGHVPHQISCDHGTLLVLPGVLPPGSTREGGLRLANTLARSTAPGGPAQFAIDGELVVMAIGASNRVGAILDAALGDATVEMRASAGDDGPLPAGLPAANALAAWKPPDLLAAVQSTGESILSSNTNGSAPYVVVVNGSESASVYLGAQASLTLAALKRGNSPFAYAVDDDMLLMVTGTPRFTNVDFVKRVLGGARATAIGAHPSP
jgi:hypothetical protein